MKSDVFKVELERFKNNNIKESTITVLEDLPDYFYQVPSSISDKHNPVFALGEGGLVRHVKVCMRILEELFCDESFGKHNDYTQDLMRMALMLHDGFKYGISYSNQVCDNHPLIMADYLLKNKDRLYICKSDVIFVSNMIKSHMGTFNKDKDGNIIMPGPKSREEVMIHLCDYIASRDFLNVDFENNEIVDSENRKSILSLKKNKKN